MYKIHLKYLKYVLLHKWYVFWECLHVRAGLWRAIRHDWTKFTKTEWSPYVKWFYARPTGKLSQQRAKNIFMDAWRSHVGYNDHHWEYWTKREAGKMYATVMPENCVREMVADWRGVCRAKGQSREMAVVWYLENQKKVALHPYTRAQVELLLGMNLDKTYLPEYHLQHTMEVPEPVYRMPGS